MTLLVEMRKQRGGGDGKVVSTDVLISQYGGQEIFIFNETQGGSLSRGIEALEAPSEGNKVSFVTRLGKDEGEGML